jgi:hypothetical protein
MKRFVLMLLLAGPLLAAEVKVAPEIKAKAGRLVRASATSDNKAPIRWINAHADLDVIGVELGRTAIISSPVPGNYLVHLHSDAGGEPVPVLVVIEGVAPAPPVPVPPAPVPPPIPPEPKPVAGPLWLVVVEETGDAKPDRGAFWRSPFTLAAVKGHTVRRTDKDAKDKEGNAPADLAPYIARASGKALPQLYVVASNGAVLSEGALPASGAALQSLMSKLTKAEARP